ncbi:MAG: hypothetical protein KBE42_08710 [Steroidobacteraceae bacterium]|nr:hypothetical protein [Steroidobacteraceae bacterium]
MIGKLVTRFAAGLRFPTLFLMVGSLFVVDLLMPDLVPLVDEVMLALGTLLLASFRKRRGRSGPTPPADARRTQGIY